jgi:hypothetical protein
MSYKILARDGSEGDFVNIVIEARTLAGALAKLRAFGRDMGFFSLHAWSIEEV